MPKKSGKNANKEIHHPSAPENGDFVIAAFGVDVEAAVVAESPLLVTPVLPPDLPDEEAWLCVPVDVLEDPALLLLDADTADVPCWLLAAVLSLP